MQEKLLTNFQTPLIKKKKKNSSKNGTEGTYLNILRPYMINPQQTLFSIVNN